MRFKIVLLLISILVVGCKSDRRPRQAHSVESQQSESAAQNASEVRASGSTGNPLSGKAMENPAVVGTVDFGRNLQKYNEVFSEKLKAGSAKAEEIALYEGRLLAGCDEQLYSCSNLKTFRSSNLSAVIAWQIARTKKDVHQYYRLLMVAYELQNRVYDHNLALLYLERAQEYASALQNNLKLLHRHGRVVTTLMIDFQTRASAAEVARILAQFDIWKHSRSKPGLLGSNSAVLFNLAAKGYLYVDGKLNPSLVKCIENMQTEKDSFSSRLESLKFKNAYLLKALGTDQLPAKDEYFYIADRLFQGHLGLDEATAMWQASNKDREKLAKFLRAVLAVELVTTVREANSQMREFFSRASELPIRKMLYDTIDRSSNLIPLFDRLMSKAKLARDFIDRTLRAEDKIYRETYSAFDSIDNNIKFMATYPHMMMLAYHLSKAQFTMSVRFFFFTIEIDSATILKDLFDGTYGPFFGYAKDQSPLSSMDLLNSAYFAFQLDTFSDFNVDPDDFMKSIAQTMLSLSVDQFRLHGKLMQEHFFNNPTYRDYISACEKAKKGTFAPSLTLSEFLENPLLGVRLNDLVHKLGGTLRLVTENGGLKVIKFDDGFHIYSNINSEVMTTIHNRTMPILFRLRSMMLAYRTSLVQRGFKEGAIAAKVKNSEAYLKMVEGLIDGFLSAFTRVHRESSSCYYSLQRADADMRNSLMSMEREYLGKVHDAMSRIRQQPSLEQELNASLRTNTSALRIRPLERFDGNTFSYNRLDFVARTVQFLRAVNPQARVIFPPDLRMNPNGGWSGRAAPISTPLSLTVEYHADKNTFIEWAMKAHYSPIQEVNEPGKNHGGPPKLWTGWFSYNSAHLSQFGYERRIIAALHRMGYLKSSEIVSRVEEQVQHMQASDADAELYRIFGMSRLHENMWLKDIFVNLQSGSINPVFEDMFAVSASPLIDYYAPPSAAGQDSSIPYYLKPWTELGMQYVLSRKFRSTFIVAIDPAFDLKMDEDMRKYVMRDADAPLELVNAIREREKQDLANPDRRIVPRVYIDRPTAPVPYLLDSQVGDFKATWREFHDDTGGFYRQSSQKTGSQ